MPPSDRRATALIRWRFATAGRRPSTATAFTQEIDRRGKLDRSGMILVSRWNSAPLARHVLLYNFRPKLEWTE